MPTVSGLFTHARTRVHTQNDAVTDQGEEIQQQEERVVNKVYKLFCTQTSRHNLGILKTGYRSL